MGKLIDGRRLFGLRAALFRKEAPELARSVDVGGPMAEGVSRYLLAQGTGAAAWLAWRHRRSLEVFREMRFHLPGGAELPLWFACAISAFEARPLKWRVARVRRPDAVEAISIRWLGGKGPGAGDPDGPARP